MRIYYRLGSNPHATLSTIHYQLSTIIYPCESNHKTKIPLNSYKLPHMVTSKNAVETTAFLLLVGTQASRLLCL
ncbi:MAG: hypothetical protein LBE12_02365 [Planctomycetaceae bacterium]|nr:hypothetical protein [Planctomycetaceae bacterium]